MLELLNPDAVHEPIGAYSHTATVPAGTELVFVSGQVGVHPDGTTPTTLAAQADAAFANLRACLAALARPALLLEVEAVAVKQGRSAG